MSRHLKYIACIIKEAFAPEYQRTCDRTDTDAAARHSNGGGPEPDQTNQAAHTSSRYLRGTGTAAMARHRNGNGPCPKRRIQEQPTWQAHGRRRRHAVQLGVLGVGRSPSPVPEHWIAGSLGRWIIGSLDHWTTGSLDHWITGSLDHWITG